MLMVITMVIVRLRDSTSITNVMMIVMMMIVIVVMMIVTTASVDTNINESGIGQRSLISSKVR
jgi:hypothetical protein